MTTDLMYDRIFHYSINEIIPEREVVFQSQGIGQEKNVPQKITGLYDYALSMFTKDAEPEGLIKEISIPEFAEAFQGNGENEPDTPVQHVFPRADCLALFAFTLGKKISDTITELFSGKDFALAYMLDSIASASADQAASITEQGFLSKLNERIRMEESAKTLLYSPGYCGWHISGQQQLFKKLQPERIGISLNSQYLMIPLKSISGV
ncbi:MAG: vitamin B12 dependent-methionine synthase activation domain-containing protein [Bacteroidota bacterium]